MEKDPDPVLSVSLSYIAAGLACIPITPPTHPNALKAGKAPLVKGWQKSPLTPDSFKRHFRSGMNVGVVTGKASGIVVIDIDPRNGGMRWFVENEDRLGHCLRETTGAGGIHLYYRYPPERGHIASLTGQNALAPGVELLADGGHQVVTAPSVHKCGKPYVMEHGLTLLDLDAEADYPPAWILEAAGGKQPPREKSSEENGHFVDTAQNIERVREILASFRDAVEGQGGDLTTFQAACIGRDYGLSPHALWPLMLQYNQTKCRPPWEEKDLKAKVANAYRYAKGGVGEASPERQFEEEPQDDKLLTPSESEKQEEKILGATRYRLKRPVVAAKLFVERHGQQVRFHRDAGYVYDRQHHVWRFLCETELRTRIERDIETLSPKLHLVLKSAKLREIADFVKLRLQDDSFKAELDTWLDDTPGRDYVTVQNGILDIGGRNLRPHSPNWFSFNKLPFGYEPKAQCPGFLSFLNSLWPEDHDIKDCLRLWMGYLLLSESNAQKFALLIGASRAGKGVLSRIVEKLVGKEGYCAATMTSLAGEFGLTQLMGKRIVMFHDAYKAQGSMGDVATERLISIVGRDAQVINRKYHDPITCALPVKVMLVCNELPAFVNSRGALSNRMIVFPFNRSFAGQEDLKLEDRLESELPGILNWALEGAKRISAGEPLRQPRCAEETFSDIKRTLEPVVAFIEEMIEFIDPHPWNEDRDEYPDFVTAETLYEAYRQWCSQNGHSPRAKNKFSMVFAAASPSTVKRQRIWLSGAAVRIFANIRIRTAPSPAEFN